MKTIVATSSSAVNFLRSTVTVTHSLRRDSAHLCNEKEEDKERGSHGEHLRVQGQPREVDQQSQQMEPLPHPQGRGSGGGGGGGGTGGRETGEREERDTDMCRLLKGQLLAQIPPPIKATCRDVCTCDR